ncbi:Exosome complex component Rrp41, partial [Bienertia sinuspersici]
MKSLRLNPVPRNPFTVPLTCSNEEKKGEEKTAAETVPTPRSTPANRKEVAIDYYDIDFNGEAKFKEKYEMLFKRGVLATKLGNLLMTKAPTSMRAILEFLSSLKVHMFHNPSSGNHLSITFRLFNEDHTWTLEKFNEALGLPIGGPRVTHQHWNEEIGRIISVEQDYDSKRSYVTSIRHTALRYVIKVFSNTIFGRKEGSKVRKDETFMLHHMLHATPINTGAFLIHQLQSMANHVNTGG